MTYFLFLVNPTLAYDPYPDWLAWAPQLKRGQRPPTTWNTGTRRRGMRPGDRGFIIKTGVHPKGLVGACVLTSDIYVGPHWNPEARRAETGYVDIEMVKVIDLDDPVTLGELALVGPGVLWTPRQSGTAIPEDVGQGLWSTFVDETESIHRPSPIVRY